ncbi:MAG TPA: DOMON-like domain-containing protein [Sphingobium sp.]|nr:DOMON-like domain-containing protein [Sphingobium sp.]
MEFDLVCHAASRMPAIEAVRVQVERQHGWRLALQYQVVGDISTVVMPLIMAQERADELWRTTCFELFLSRPGIEGYLELNFSPSSRWAAYGFERYRSGRKIMDRLEVSRLDIRVSPNTLELGVMVDISCIAPEKHSVTWQAGLSAIVETKDGEKSYWALAHGADKPDFHRRDCFVALLEAPASE